MSTRKASKKEASHSLTSGSIEGTFEEAVRSIQKLGYSQAVFEVERLGSPKNGVPSLRDADAPIVLRPSACRVPYPQIKPGDIVLCPGLAKDAPGSPALFRVRRMAEGLSWQAMTEFNA
jgi:hypothetical protein